MAASEMPRSLRYYFYWRELGLRPAEVDALDPQTLADLVEIRKLDMEIRAARNER